MRAICLTVLSVGMILAAPAAASAATATGTFPVNATVLRACAVTANPLNFGNYDPTSATALDGTTTLAVLCTIGTSFQVGLNAGAGTGATVSARRMTSGANVLNYALYQDASRTTNWGNTPGTDTPAAATAAATASNLTVYGRVAAGQNVPPAAYTDTITITVTY